MKPHHPERRAAIEAAFGAGISPNELASKLGITPGGLWSYCRYHGIRIPCQYHTYFPSPKIKVNCFQVLAELLYTQDSQAVIARRLGVTTQRISEVKRLAEQAGIQGLRPGPGTRSHYARLRKEASAVDPDQ